ncbi:MAG: hypothetical protein ACR2KS_10285 [Candidatus Eremiobacter antarcticus]|nr:hypothetical protein [Candidatus Eremiobacteraeota bacterium]MBC5808821.1 hypothetical protein [Candidatus Eremiobacteraeota bacterium]
MAPVIAFEGAAYVINRYTHLKHETDETRRGNATFRAGVKARDGFRCHAERRSIAGIWFSCGKRTSPDPHHIYPRRNCGAAIFDPNVGIAVCRQCHDDLTNHKGDVRVPLVRVKVAYETIQLAAKLPPPGVKPVTIDGVCRMCGCTDELSCPDGCYWVESDLCSQCCDCDR